jgi:hypothetical protein
MSKYVAVKPKAARRFRWTIMFYILQKKRVYFKELRIFPWCVATRKVHVSLCAIMLALLRKGN